MSEIPDDWEYRDFYGYSPSRFDPETDHDTCLKDGSDLRQIDGGLFQVVECVGCDCYVFIR